MEKKLLAHGLGDLSDGLHDPPLRRINWNTDNAQLSTITT